MTEQLERWDEVNEHIFTSLAKMEEQSTLVDCIKSEPQVPMRCTGNLKFVNGMLVK